MLSQCIKYHCPPDVGVRRGRDDRHTFAILGILIAATSLTGKVCWDDALARVCRNPAVQQTRSVSACIFPPQKPSVQINCTNGKLTRFCLHPPFPSGVLDFGLLLYGPTNYSENSGEGQSQESLSRLGPSRTWSATFAISIPCISSLKPNEYHDDNTQTTQIPCWTWPSFRVLVSSSRST